MATRSRRSTVSYGNEPKLGRVSAASGRSKKLGLRSSKHVKVEKTTNTTVDADVELIKNSVADISIRLTPVKANNEQRITSSESVCKKPFSNRISETNVPSRALRPRSSQKVTETKRVRFVRTPSKPLPLDQFLEQSESDYEPSNGEENSDGENDEVISVFSESENEQNENMIPSPAKKTRVTRKRSGLSSVQRSTPACRTPNVKRKLRGTLPNTLVPKPDKIDLGEVF